MTDRARHAHATPDKLRYRPEVPLLRSTAPRRCPGGLLLPILAAALVAAPVTPARADSLQIDLQVNPERGFQVVQELSYEVIVVGTDGYLAELRLRVALHNASNREQDTVLSLALPRGAEIHGLSVARDGVWTPGKPAGIAADPGRRESGTVVVRPLAPVADGDLPGAELVAFSLDPATTTQVELHLRAPVRLRGDRWELELPGRGDERDGLAGERRVLVKPAQPPTANPSTPSAPPPFWVDGSSNAGQPYLVTQPEDRAIVSWPIEQGARARSNSSRPLDAHLAVLPDPGDARSGRFRLHLRLGAAAPPRPDHVILLIDRSRSTTPSMHREAMAAVAGLFDALPAGLTFDAISFARKARPLLPEPQPTTPTSTPAIAWPEVHDKPARERIAAVLDAGSREQGTDLAAALTLAGQRINLRDPRRPLVLIITDGMLPLGAGAGPLGQVFSDSLGKRRGDRPELIFLVDEPMLVRTGIAADHPIAQLAAGLGARISLANLAQYGRDGGEAFARNLLRAPGVLRELSVGLPPHAVLDDPPPAGLVAGNQVVLAGTYTRGVPTVRVRGKLGKTQQRLQPRPEKLTPPPAALVASVRPAGPAQAVAEGFALPPWYGRKHQRSAKLGITWAGRGRLEDRGHLDEKIFRRYLGTRVFPRARVCYNQALTRNQSLGGRVVFEFEVGKGEVMLASTDLAGLAARDAGFERCLLEAAWMLDIPAGNHDDQIYRIRYPLVFNPPKTGRPSLDEGALGTGTVELLLNLGR